MKIDLTGLLKREEPPFRSLEEAKDRVARYLLSFIHIELEGLPKKEWDKTLNTWLKIIGFAKNLVRLSEEKRREIYGKYKFDGIMEGIMEESVKTILGLYLLGLSKPQDEPKEILRKIIELIYGDKEIYEREKFKEEIIDYIKEFLEKKRED